MSRPQQHAPYKMEEVEEAGGFGDEIDTVSLRDVAATRFIKYQEWMDQVSNRPSSVTSIEPVPSSAFAFPTDLQARVEQAQKELEELKSKDTEEIQFDEKSKYFKEMIIKLRENFGTVGDGDVMEEQEQILKNKFNLQIVKCERLKVVKPQGEIPEAAPVHVADGEELGLGADALDFDSFDFPMVQD